MAELLEITNPPATPDTVALEPRPQGPVSRLLRKGLSYATMSAMIVPFCMMTGLVASVKPEETDTRPYAASTPNPGVQDVEVLSVESTTNNVGLTNKDIAQSVRRADKLLRFGTFGARGLGSVSIKNIMMEPSGSVTVEHVDIPCYTTDQVQTMYGKFFPDSRVNLADPSKQYMVMLENDNSCSFYDGAAAFADMMWKDTSVTVYNMHDIYTNAGMDGVLQAELHEWGHTWGFGHDPSIDCNPEKGNFSDKSIQWQIAHGCALKKDESGKKIDEYASLSSVMGNDWQTDVSGRSLPYSFLEMSRLNPDLEIEPIDPVPGMYRLSIEPGQPIGVKINLPADHALGKVMPGADSIYFGLNDSGGWQKKTKKGETVTASDPRISFSIDALVTSPYTRNIASLDTPKDTYLGSLTSAQKILNNEPGVTLNLASPFYVDTQLGISVSAGIGSSGYYIKVNSLS